MVDLVVDTDVVSYGLRQDRRFTDFYGPAMQGSRLVISFMTVAELKFGALSAGWGEKRLIELQEYLGQHYIRYFPTEATCDAWAELVSNAKSQGRILKGADAWIAATALVLSVPLVTHNAKDFDYLPKLNIISLRNP